MIAQLPPAATSGGNMLASISATEKRAVLERIAEDANQMRLLAVRLDHDFLAFLLAMVVDEA